MKLLPWLTVALCAGVALAVFTAHGCAGNCASDCPVDFVQIGSPDNAQLAIPNGGLAWRGPACPNYLPTCQGNGVTTSCSYLIVYGAAEGYCDVLMAFSDRQSEVVHTVFGPRITQGCCNGFSIEGPRTFYVPDRPNKGLIYADGGTDAVSLLPDGSADGATDASGSAHDAGHDASTGRDAGADSLPADAK
jgi:hypothetical protein